MQAVIEAEVNALPGSFQYAIFYSASLRYLEHDPFQEIVFAVSTKLETEATLKLHLWNETLVCKTRFIKNNLTAYQWFLDISK